MKLQLSIDVETVEYLGNDVIARVFYPTEGNKILIKKGLNVIELSEAIYHEIGHLIDWYISNGNQSTDINIREENAIKIGESLRYKEFD